ncbi:MAG: 30S ribosome-binding factor RbfA [Planctomycetaceae bacterium]|nr:30S ribosome-binding factor RbfA [Planctomycetaceae bacterium]
MTSHRSLRVAEAIREVVAAAVLFEAADPRLRSVTVLRAEVSADLRQATVYVSVMGSQADARLALRGLKHAAGFLQSKVADRLQMRYTPVLSFKLDDSVKKSIEIGRLIDEAVASDQRPVPPAEEPPGQEHADSSGGVDSRDLAPPDRS